MRSILMAAMIPVPGNLYLLCFVLFCLRKQLYLTIYLNECVNYVLHDIADSILLFTLMLFYFLWQENDPA